MLRRFIKFLEISDLHAVYCFSRWWVFLEFTGIFNTLLPQDVFLVCQFQKRAQFYNRYQRCLRNRCNRLAGQSITPPFHPARADFISAPLRTSHKEIVQQLNARKKQFAAQVSGRLNICRSIITAIAAVAISSAMSSEARALNDESPTFGSDVNGNLGECSVEVENDGVQARVTIRDGDGDVAARARARVDRVNDWSKTDRQIENVCAVEGDSITLINPTENYAASGRFGLEYAAPDGSVTFYGVGPAGDENAESLVSEFESYQAEIRQAAVDEAQRSLTATLSANRRMVDQAFNRFLEARRNGDNEDEGIVTRDDIPFDVDGSFAIDGLTLSTRGNFFAQQRGTRGADRRLFFGDFDLQHDDDTGSTTATVTARVAWERMLSESTMLGYFVGGELAYSDIDGAFEGDQNRLAATIGAYAVHVLDEQVFVDGFVSLGAGRNDLDMANDVLALESDYTTQTFTIGTAVSGVYEYDRYEFRPELAFSYVHTWVGNVGFTGRAYGLVDDTLSMDAGNVSIASLTLRTEVIWGLDASSVADSTSQISFAPRLICERVETSAISQDCGGGLEMGLTSSSDDGLTQFNLRILADRVGGTTRTGLELGLEHRF